MLTAYIGNRLVLSNNNGCCGFWELTLNSFAEELLYSSKAKVFKDLMTDLKAMQKNAVCSENAAGLKGAGLIFVNLVSKVTVDEEMGETAEEANWNKQTFLRPFVAKLGFKFARRYYNPRSKNWLRLYTISGEELDRNITSL